MRKHVIINQVFGFTKKFENTFLYRSFFLVLQYLEITLWAAVYMAIPALDKISRWEEAINFSTVTYTTLGYGDITLLPVWRIMSGFEAMNGILMFGWSTTMFFAVVQKIVTTKYIKKLNEYNYFQCLLFKNKFKYIHLIKTNSHGYKTFKSFSI